jgi:tetratricopeptide (TPR) repeat protein
MFEGWRPWLAYARAAMHRLRGELEAADAELQAALREAGPGEHRAWLIVAPAHADLLLVRGDFEGALREAGTIADAVKTLALDLTATVAAERVRALAQSSLGEHDAARASLERAFGLARELMCDGLPLALLHEARARISLAAEDAEQCVAALTALRILLERADAPALVNAYEALREEGSKHLAIPELPAAVTVTRSLGSESTAMFTEVRTRMNAFSARQERAEQALQLLLEDSGAEAGHLFLFDAGGLFAAASIGNDFANERLLSEAQKQVDAELGSGKTEAVTVADLVRATAIVRGGQRSDESDRMPVMLSSTDESSALVGVALLNLRGRRLRVPRNELVLAIGRCLQEAGDSIPFAG